MSEIVLDVDATSSTTVARMDITEETLAATEVSPRWAPVSHVIPPVIDSGQAYYWSYAWQLGEQESRAELAAGEKRSFDSADDAIRWLLSADE